jgi:6-phosphogluconolactonase
MVYAAGIDCTPGNQSCADGSSSDGIYAYLLNPATGELTDVPGSPFNTASNSFAVATSPSGTFVFVSNLAIEEGDPPTTLGENSILAYRHDHITGVLALSGKTTLSSSPGALLMHPSGKFLYTITGGVLGFTVDPNTGNLALIQLPEQIEGGGASGIAIDPTGQFFYVATTSNQISGFRVDQTTGTMTELPGSPFTVSSTIGLPSLQNLSMHPSGRFLYAEADFTNPVSFATFGFAIDQSTGVLTPLPDSPYLHSDTFLGQLDFARGGASAYATTNSRTQAELSVNTSSGTLTTTHDSVTGTFVSAPAIDTSGQFLYVGSSGILGYHIQGDGSLQRLPGFPHGKGTLGSVAVAPM